jgi:signal transduction histidine kinase
MCVLRGVFVGNVSATDRRSLDELLATLGHELRGPLAPILNSLEILKLSGAFTHGHTSEACSVIERQVQCLNQLINSLLEVARISRGALQMVTEPTDVAAIMRDAIERSRPMIDGRRHELVVDFDGPRAWIAGDRLRLMQVFTSLLNNAAKYTDYGGRIEIIVRRDDRDVLIRVKDNGMGIPAALLGSIFDMFVQADRSAGRGGSGLGIGLTLARGIVSLHGGTIEAFSGGPGLGSEFIVRLPRLGYWQGVTRR